eukprot:10012797-Karenia_brevis.AAC.1
MDKELLQLKKTIVTDGKQSIGYDVAASNVSDVFESARLSLVVGERDTSQTAPMNNTSPSCI